MTDNALSTGIPPSFASAGSNAVITAFDVASNGTSLFYVARAEQDASAGGVQTITSLGHATLITA